MKTKQILPVITTLALIVTLFGTIPATAAPGETTQPAFKAPPPKFSTPAAFDVSPALLDLAKNAVAPASGDLPEERGPIVTDRGFSGDGAIQASSTSRQLFALAIPAPSLTFEGLRNTDNPFRADGTQILVNPPDPIGDVGPHNYVEMVNLVFAVYDKSGTMQLGPVPLGALWDGFAIPDCTDLSGDPVVLYDQLSDRWVLSQFTTSGLDDPTLPFWNCVAISTTGDPTGTYYRYAFETGHLNFFPDYPKYGVWTDTYVITTREFGPTVEYGIGVYGLEKNNMINGQPARAVSFFLDGNDPAILPLV